MRLQYGRSVASFHQKLREVIDILENSILMVEYFDLQEFNNVIALQLRILLCDTVNQKENSLITKVFDAPTFFPLKNQFNLFKIDANGVGESENQIFDYTSERLCLNDWLNQTVCKIRIGNKVNPLTIRNFIKFTANKSGGAHVDNDLEFKHLFVEVNNRKLICEIGRCFLKSQGRNIDVTIPKRLSYLVSTLAETR